MNDIEDAVTAQVEDLTSSDTFDVLEFVRGAARPKAEVTIGTDAEAAKRLAKIYADEKAHEEALKKAEKSGKADSLSIGDEYFYVDEDEIQELRDRLADTSITFHLEGLAPAARKAIEKKIEATVSQKTDPEKYWELINHTFVAKSIVGITVRGERYNGKWTPEKVAAFDEEVYEGEFAKLASEVASITYVGQEFDDAVSADF